MDEKPLDLNQPMEITARDGHKLVARRLTRDDAAALVAFNDSLSPVSQRRFLPHAYDPDTLKRALQRSEALDDLILGLFDGENLVGYFFLWYFQDRVPLLGIGLRDAYQARGLGTPMMNLLLRAARETGKEGVELTTMQDNDRAYALYEKCGFKYYGDVENLTGDGTVFVERAMFYEIEPGAKPMDKPHGPPV